MSVTYELPARKGTWLAQIMGPDPKYKLEREWAPRRYVKRDKGTFVYSLAPGYYEECRWEHGVGKVRKYWRVDELTRAKLPEYAVPMLDVIAAGPAPGVAGCWGDIRCACGSTEVATYDATGFPYCGEHEPVTSDVVAADLPSPIGG